MSNEELENLKKEAFDSIDNAYSKVMDYAKNLPLGDDRIHWFDSAERIRLSTHKQLHQS